MKKGSAYPDAFESAWADAMAMLTKTDPKARRYERLTFDEAIAAQLKIMDLTALSMCMEQRLPIVVFDFKVRGNIKAVVEGRPIGTMITCGEK